MEENEEFSIGIGFRRALVYGNKEADTTKRAVEYFLENKLFGFLDNLN